MLVIMVEFHSLLCFSIGHSYGKKSSQIQDGVYTPQKIMKQLT